MFSLSKFTGDRSVVAGLLSLWVIVSLSSSVWSQGVTNSEDSESRRESLDGSVRIFRAGKEILNGDVTSMPDGNGGLIIVPNTVVVLEGRRKLQPGKAFRITGRDLTVVSNGSAILGGDTLLPSGAAYKPSHGGDDLFFEKTIPILPGEAEVEEPIKSPDGESNLLSPPKNLGLRNRDDVEAVSIPVGKNVDKGEGEEDEFTQTTLGDMDIYETPGSLPEPEPSSSPRPAKALMRPRPWLDRPLGEVSGGAGFSDPFGLKNFRTGDQHMDTYLLRLRTVLESTLTAEQLAEIFARRAQR